MIHDTNIGRSIRVCHIQALIVDTTNDGYVAEAEIGNVVQRITLSAGYVHAQLAKHRLLSPKKSLYRSG